MDPKTVNLVIFAEQMAALLAKTVADISAVIKGESQKTADDILADADATYQQIIGQAQAKPQSS